MGYAGTNKGGTSAILAAEALLRERAAETSELTPQQVASAMGPYVDRIMGEAGLWDEDLAGRALLQAAGDQAEAVHLLRAHRSTLPRLAFTEPINPDDIALCRRVVPAHRSPDGPQLLGETVDYSPRLITEPGQDPLDTDPATLLGDAAATPSRDYVDQPVQRFTAWLADHDLLLDRTDPTDPEPYDLTLNPISLPAPRSALLSAMAIAETGALVNCWYRGVTGPDGHTDESITLGEVRYGHLEVSVVHPHLDEPVVVGAIRASECETMAHLDERGEDPGRFDAGYGFALGHNERKVIAMAAMDLAVTRFGHKEYGSAIEQVIMHTTDGLAANGFLEHLKLPHYVTFRSQMERAEAANAEGSAAVPPARETVVCDCGMDHSPTVHHTPDFEESLR